MTELAELRWRKSSYSDAKEDACVEVARVPRAFVAVRDSKHPDGAVLAFEQASWSEMLSGLKRLS